MATRSSLKPVGKLFEDTWILYKKNINALALVGVIPLIFAGAKMVLQPGFIVSYGYPLWVSIVLLTAAAVFALLHLVFTIVLPISLAQAVDESHRGKTVEVAYVYKKAFTEVIQYIFVVMLVVIVVLGGSVLFIIPGIIASIYLKFAIFAYIFEDKRGMDALVASAWYVRGSWWALLFRQILLAVVLVFAGLIFAVISGVVLITLGSGVTMFNIIFQLFAFMILIPFAMVYLYILYKDAKSTKDGREPDKKFVDESETLFIILLIVAAVTTLIFFFLSTYAHWTVGWNGQSRNGGYMNGGYTDAGMMHRRFGQVDNVNEGRYNIQNGDGSGQTY